MAKDYTRVVLDQETPKALNRIAEALERLVALAENGGVRVVLPEDPPVRVVLPESPPTRIATTS